MTDVLWIDILICVLCSALGGVIVATLSEFSPYAPSKVRRAVLVTFWLIFLLVASVVIGYHFWGGDGIWAAVLAYFVLFFVFAFVIDAFSDKEDQDQESESENALYIDCHPHHHPAT